MTTLELDNETATLLAEMAEQEHIEPEQLVKDLIKRHSETLTAPENDFFCLCWYLARPEYRPRNHPYGRMAARPTMILCDTNILIEFYKGNPATIQALRDIG